MPFARHSMNSRRDSIRAQKLHEITTTKGAEPNIRIATHHERGYSARFFVFLHACGLKKSGLDLGLMVSETPATAAAVFTTNRVKAAPVITSQLHLKKSRTEMRGIIVNSGNANCCTGSEGFTAATATTLKVAKELGNFVPRKFWFVPQASLAFRCDGRRSSTPCRSWFEGAETTRVRSPSSRARS